jgi:3',5'-cyclic-AMP phosphodiesterase
MYFVQISDTHIGPTRDYERHGYASYPCAERLVELLNNLPVKPEFVIHTGDVVTEPDPRSYRLAAALFSRLELPIYYVNGNHDTAADIKQYLPMAAKEDAGSDPNQLSYSFNLKGERFLVLDGRAPDELDPHGALPEKQLAWLRQEATPDGLPLTIFLHFPVVPLNAPWMDAHMRLLNWEAVHEALRPAVKRLRGVFYGHVHQSLQIARDGIRYTAAPSSFAQFTAWPSDTEPQIDRAQPPGYNFVHLLPEQTIVRPCWFERP